MGAATTVEPGGHPLAVADLAREANELRLSEFVVRRGRWFLVRQANPDDPSSAREAMILPIRSPRGRADRAPITIGSDPACDLVLDAPGVGGLHAQLLDLHAPLEWPTLHVERTESSHGVGVDRLDVTPGGRAQLFNGTRLRLGDCELDVVSALAMHAWLRRYS